MKSSLHKNYTLISLFLVGIHFYCKTNAQELDYNEVNISIQSQILNEERRVTLFYPTDTSKKKWILVKTNTASRNH